MCDDMMSDYAYDYAENEYRSGYDSGYEAGRDSREWEIEDLQEEIAELERRLMREQIRSGNLGIALLSTGLPSHFVEAIANGS